MMQNPTLTFLPQSILIVDDDARLVALLHEHFAEKGYRVITASDGNMAIQIARKQNPDLILMDVDMPITNGLRSLEMLRQLPEAKHIPVIFITGIASLQLYTTIDNHQRVSYLKKPIDLCDLSSLVSEFLRQYHAA